MKSTLPELPLLFGSREVSCIKQPDAAKMEILLVISLFIGNEVKVLLYYAACNEVV